MEKIEFQEKKKKKKYLFEVCIVAEYHGWVTLQEDDNLVVGDPTPRELESWAEQKMLRAHNLHLDMPDFMGCEHVTEVKFEEEE